MGAFHRVGRTTLHGFQIIHPEFRYPERCDLARSSVSFVKFGAVPMQRHSLVQDSTIAKTVLFLSLTLLMSLPALGQSPSQGPPTGPPVSTPQSPSITPDDKGSQDVQGDAGQFVFRKKVEEVILHAVVVDQQNDLVSNLPQTEFRVFEDGKPQEITSFHQEKVPVALGILIDNSGSMRPKREGVNRAALNLARSSDPQDEIFIVNFGEESYLDKDFTNDVSKLQAALGKIETRGSTALYDTIVASAAHMKQGAGLQKRILLVVTDGEDNASRHTLENAVEQAERSDAVIYAVGLFSDDDIKHNRRTMKKARTALAQLATATGGLAFFPESADDTEAICTQIARDIRNQYTLAYYPTNSAHDGTFRQVQVDVVPPRGAGKLSVRTRSGYFAQRTRASGN